MNIKAIAIWTVVCWVLAWNGLQGLAILAATGALVHAVVIAVGGLRRARECVVCGRSYRVGRLGMHPHCARETRWVR